MGRRVGNDFYLNFIINDHQTGRREAKGSRTEELQDVKGVMKYLTEKMEACERSEKELDRVQKELAAKEADWTRANNALRLEGKRIRKEKCVSINGTAAAEPETYGRTEQLRRRR